MRYDVIVNGAGLAGLSCAASLRCVSLALIAAAIPSPREEPGFDTRVYAISPGNAAILNEIGAWELIAEDCRAPVRGMRIYGDDGRAQLAFDAYEAGVPELAWIVEDRHLQEALWHVVRSRAEVEIFAPAQCDQVEIGARAASVRLRDGRQLEARLIVGADGARSLVRTQAGIGLRERAYPHSAVVANFACERPHRDIAYQWFLGGPVLALLPLPGNAVSMVWSVATAEAERLLDLDAKQLAAETARAARGALGELRLLGQPAAFALRRLRADRLVAERIALLGDAAHVIHPLAGQGMNLGLRDAHALSRVLSEREPGRDPGDVRLLRRYERLRAEDNLAMDWTVHGLFTLFGARTWPARGLRNAGLNLTDRLPVLKTMLMRQAMG